MKDFEAWKLFEATGNPHAFMIYSKERDRNKKAAENDSRPQKKNSSSDIMA